MRALVLLCSALTAAPPAAAQETPPAPAAPAAGAAVPSPATLRRPVPLAPDVGRAFDVGSGGERSVVLFEEAGPPWRTAVRVSDGRGLSWSEPVSLDADPELRLGVGRDGIAVVGEHLYVAWREGPGADGNGGGGVAYLARSHDGGQRWSHPLRLGLPPGTGCVDLQLALVPDRPDDHLYVLLRAASAEPGSQELFLVASHDGGTTFTSPARVSSAGGAELGSARLVAEGLALDVVWVDDRDAAGGSEVWLRTSTDGGASWEGPERRLSRGLRGTACRAVRLARAGSDRVVLWLEPEGPGAPPGVRAAVSGDGGASYAPDVLLGAFPAQGEATSAELHTDGAVFLALWTRRPSTTGARCVVESSRSLDGGRSWTSALALPLEGCGSPRLRVAGQGEDVGLSVVGPRLVEGEASCAGAFSSDLGLSWRPVAPGTSAGEALAPGPLAFHPRYRNYLRLSTSAEGGCRRLLVDGFRPQTVTLAGTSGPDGEAAFAFEGFSGEFPQVFVLASEAPGSFPLPGDDRDLGLHPGPLLQATLQGVDGFATTLDPTGRGVASPRSFAFLAGRELTFVAAAFDPNHFAFGSLTDAVVLRVP